MSQNYILNGQAYGSVAAKLLANGFDVGALRPWIGKDGRAYITINQGGKPKAVPVTNDTAALRKDEWKVLDEAVLKAARERLRLVADIRAAGLTFTIPNGMGKTVLETQSMNDPGRAVISMDPAAKETEADRPVFDLTNLPLPVIHKDFYFNIRELAASRNSGTPLDTTMAEAAARRVSEEIERLTLGVTGTVSYGGGTIYGLTNFPKAITSVNLTAPTDSGWTPATTVQEVLAMRQASIDNRYYGPWRLYVSPAWEQYLDDDYSQQKGDNTLRQRLKAIEGIQDVVSVPYLEGFKMILLQMTSDVIRLVIGLDITTVQWESHGGLRQNFKVMAIIVPQLRADYYSRTGIVYATTA